MNQPSKPREIPRGATICAHLVEPYDCCVCFPRDIKQCRLLDDCPEHGETFEQAYGREWRESVREATREALETAETYNRWAAQIEQRGQDGN